MQEALRSHIADAARPLFPAHSIYCPSAPFVPSAGSKTKFEIQANGLGGHLDETWADVGPNSGWLDDKCESWERGPCYTDGLVRHAWTLNDDRLNAKAQRFVDRTLDHQGANGMIGPASNDGWWPRYGSPFSAWKSLW
jgi:hypothetical protein